MTIPLLAQYYSTNTTGCSLWVAHSWTCALFFAKGQTIERRWLAYQEPVTENFTGNLANVFRSSATRTIRNNLLHKEL